MFVFAPDLHIARLSRAGGDIKAIWPTCSDLTCQKGSQHFTENFQRHWKAFFFNSFWHHTDKRFSSYTMASLCKSTIILTFDTFKVEISEYLAFYFAFWCTSREKRSQYCSVLWAFSDVSCQQLNSEVYFLWLFILFYRDGCFFSFCAHANYPVPTSVIKNKL